MDVITLNEIIDYLDDKPKCKIAVSELRKLLVNQSLSDFVHNRQRIVNRPDNMNRTVPRPVPYDLWFC